jgi:hypothetical protein
VLSLRGRGKIMSAAQRLSRGFHRLGFFLAAIPLIVGIIAIAEVTQQGDRAIRQHAKLECVHNHIAQARRVDEQGHLFEPLPEGYELVWQDGYRISLKQVGCSVSEYDTITYGEARNPPDFDWLNALGLPLALAVAATLAVSLAVYGLVRAIGWVIGGFAAA